MEAGFFFTADRSSQALGPGPNPDPFQASTYAVQPKVASPLRQFPPYAQSIEPRPHQGFEAIAFSTAEISSGSSGVVMLEKLATTFP